MAGFDVPEELETDAATLLGSEIKIRGITFEVIGIMAEKGTESRDDPDESIYIPFRTGEFRMFGTDRLSDITVQMHDPDQMDAVLLEIETILRREHRLRPDQGNDFRIRDRTQFLTAQAEAGQTMTFLLAGIAAVSLVVGGIGALLRSLARLPGCGAGSNRSTPVRVTGPAPQFIGLLTYRSSYLY